MLENTKSSAVITISVWLVQTPAAWAGGRISARYVQDFRTKSLLVCVSSCLVVHILFKMLFAVCKFVFIV